MTTGGRFANRLINPLRAQSARASKK